MLPHRAEWERPGFFLERETSCVIIFDFGGFYAGRFEESDEERAEHVARTDHPCGHAINAGVEIIQTDMNSLRISVRNDLSSDAEKVIRERHDVIAVPTDATADVEQDFRQKLQDAGDFVRDALGRVVMAGIEGEELLSSDRIANVKFM